MNDVSAEEKAGVGEAAAELTVDEVAEIVATMSAEELDALEEAEKQGKARVGVQEAIDRRRAALAEAEAPDESAPDESEATEEAAAEPVTVDTTKSGPRHPGEAVIRPGVGDDLRDDEAGALDARSRPVEVNKAPEGAVLPVIIAGMWVRLGATQGVPEQYIGRDGVVVHAPVMRADGNDEISPTPYEYQTEDTEFLVKMRDTGAHLSVLRDAFAKVATDEVFLSS